MQTENYSTPLDAIDKKIIAILQQNAKTNNKELASLIGLTTTPTFERVKRLEQKGYITGYSARVNKQKLGKNLRVLCNVSLKSHAVEQLNHFENAIVKLPEISSCFHIAGNFDYLLVIEIENMESYSAFLKEKLASIPHIANVQSSFVMSTLKEE